MGPTPRRVRAGHWNATGEHTLRVHRLYARYMHATLQGYIRYACNYSQCEYSAYVPTRRRRERVRHTRDAVCAAVTYNLGGVRTRLHRLRPARPNQVCDRFSQLRLALQRLLPAHTSLRLLRADRKWTGRLGKK